LFSSSGVVELKNVSPRGLTDKASGFGPEDSGFKSWRGHSGFMKKFFLITFLLSLFLPVAASAGTYVAVYIDDSADPPTATTQNICYEGLVPCGKDVSAEGTWTDGHCQGGTTVYIPCTFCHLFVMLDGIFDFILFQLIPPLAVLMLAIGGIMYVIAYFSEAETLVGGAKGGPKLLSQAKKLITSVMVGLIIIYAGWLLVDLFFDVIGVAEWTGLSEGWFSIQCQVIIHSS
jgi:hypothetical protein